MNIKTNKDDILLLLLYAKGPSGIKYEPIKGITRLMKLLFLIDTKIKIAEKFNFEPYKIGPYSSEVYSALELFQSIPSPENPLVLTLSGNVKERGSNIEALKYFEDSISEDSEEGIPSMINTDQTYQLSEVGVRLVGDQLWNNLNRETKDIIENVKTEFGKLPLRNLLRYVYDNYPKMTTESIIKDDLYRN